ncbi:unnamed protein product [Mytilus coruscus]|uniref:Uncharacterized protein n=1 Tax=Mytilus coruscus TaxID=42192 RepID=A0A6J8A913_MYTCO|nr:unnamed protein product [Mytilus coruscus]
MIRSIALHNFVHFNEEQRLVFEDGTNFIIGGNSTGKTAVLELIRRCYSNNVNRSTTSVSDKNELAYAVCHFTIPEHYPPINISCMQQPKEILSCIFVKTSRNEKANEFEYYKVISANSNGSSFQTFIQRFFGRYGCSTEYFEENTQGCKEVTLEASLIEKVKDSGKKDEIHNFFNIITNNFEYTSEAVKTMNTLYNWLEKGYISILPMRSIGPLQWTRSDRYRRKNRDNIYKNACERAEILLHLLDNEKVDRKQEAKFSEHIVYPYKFSNLNGNISVSNSDTQDLPPKPLYKTPEGVLEAKQLTLILSHKEFSTISFEEPDRGMHPHMIKKMRDLILRQIIGKTVLIITHNPSLIDKWAMSRTFVSSKSILNETICHSIRKVPKEYVKLCECGKSEEMKNLLFSSRILFVEGKTDKIIVEAIFSLLIHDDKIQEDKRISTEQKHFLLATDIRELLGANNGNRMKKLCKQMKKEIYLLYDADMKRKINQSNEEEDVEYTFYWKNGALEQRFVDILDNCNDAKVIDAVTEIFRKKTEKDKESIEKYLDYQKELKKLKVTTRDTDTEIAENKETNASAELENNDKEKTELERKIRKVETTIKDIVKRFIPLAKFTEIEIIAAAMIHHSKEVEKFINFCAKKNLKRKHNETLIPDVANTSMQTLQSNEDELLVARSSPRDDNKCTHTGQTHEKTL